MQTEIKGVYEATADGPISEGAMVYEQSEWSVNDHRPGASLSIADRCKSPPVGGDGRGLELPSGSEREHAPF